MTKKEIKGWNTFRDGYRLNKTVKLYDGSKARIYSGVVNSPEEGERDIERIVEKRNAELKAEEDRRNGICPLGEYITSYLKKLESRICKKTGKPYAASTLLRKQNLYDCQIKGTKLDKKKINEITRQDIEIFKYGLEELTKSNNKCRLISSNTKNKVITLLQETFSDFYRMSEHPERNPMASVERYTEASHEKTMDDFLSDSEIAALMRINQKYYQEPRPRTNDRVYSEVIDLSILIHSRPGELLALKVKDYDAEAKVIHIRRTLSMGKIGEEGRAKTDKSIRDVMLNSREISIIERSIKGKKSKDLIFSSLNGGVISESCLNKCFKRRLKECGIEKELTMYRTRGTGITFALSHGADPAGVAGISGHSQKTMYQHYAAITQRQKIAAAQTTGAAFDALLEPV